VIVATRLLRNSFICINVLMLHVIPALGMVWDNRYFPWFDQLYTGTDSRHANINVNGFFITGGDAYRYQIRAAKDEQMITYPELWGELDLVPVAKSLVKIGKPNPLPTDWLWLSELKAVMPSSIEGQGCTLSGYVPITSHFGLGGSVVVQKLDAFVSVVPHQSAIDKLSLQTPGNQAMFVEVMQKVYQEIGVTSTALQHVGVGDVVLYAHFFDTHEYKYKFRKLDWGLLAGVIIPSGVKADPANLASIPFGGPYGGWAWFIAPRAEFELRDDLKFGIQGRITQRIDHTFQGRIPVGQEQVLFAPLMGNVYVDQGSTFSIAPYFVFEDIRAGLGAQLQYTINVHEHDVFRTKLSTSEFFPNFNNMNYYSGWTQEYLTVKLFYDTAHDKDWKNRPMAYFSWDIPMNHIAGRGFAKTHKISIGCNVNF
jgi:hypothetical protein